MGSNLNENILSLNRDNMSADRFFMSCGERRAAMRLACFASAHNMISSNPLERRYFSLVA
jgi:hypothetical protein